MLECEVEAGAGPELVVRALLLDGPGGLTAVSAVAVKLPVALDAEMLAVLLVLKVNPGTVVHALDHASPGRPLGPPWSAARPPAAASPPQVASSPAVGPSSPAVGPSSVVGYTLVPGRILAAVGSLGAAVVGNLAAAAAGSPAAAAGIRLAVGIVGR